MKHKLIKLGNYKFEIIPLIFTIVSIIILVNLGLWQLRRLELKNNLIQELTSRTKQIGHLEQASQNISQEKYKLIEVTGEIQDKPAILIYAGNYKFKGKAGYFLLQPLEIDNKTYILNRGWVPSHLVKAGKLQQFNQNIISTKAIILDGERKSWAIADNDLKNNIWYYANLQEIAEFWQIDNPNFMLATIYEENQTLPYGRKIDINLRNDHLQYAVTWFSFAIILFVIFILYHKKYNNYAQFKF